MKKIRIRKYKRKGKTVKRHNRRIPQSKGSLWHGPSYIHGPRLEKPKSFNRLWISKVEWTKEKYLTPSVKSKIRSYAKKHKLKLKDFPKSTKIKIGTVNSKLKPQSFMTPIYGSWTGLGRTSKTLDRMEKEIQEARPASLPEWERLEEKKRLVSDLRRRQLQ